MTRALVPKESDLTIACGASFPRTAPDFFRFQACTAIEGRSLGEMFDNILARTFKREFQVLNQKHQKCSKPEAEFEVKNRRRALRPPELVKNFYRNLELLTTTA